MQWINRISEFFVGGLNNMVSNPQFYEIVGGVLLVMSAVFSAFVCELMLKNRTSKKGKRIIFPVIANIITFLLFIAFTLLLLWMVFRFLPQKEEFFVLLKKVFLSHVKEFILPLITTMIAGWCFRKVLKGSKRAKGLLCFFLIISTVLNSTMFFWNSFRLIQRPQYSVPVESISSIINSRLRIYPFIFSSETLGDLGDGSRLLGGFAEDGDDTDGSDGSAGPLNREYEEPNDFRSYLVAIIYGTYAPGMGQYDYLHRAYELFTVGRHNNDYFYIGIMWHYIADRLDWFDEEIFITYEECCNNAIEAYGRVGDESVALYFNIARIYEKLGNREKIRECMHKALECDIDEDVAASRYKEYIFDWMEWDDYTSLMNDAAEILKYEYDLSMYVLYSAYAIAENVEVENAYELLCEADEHFQEKSALIKILKCICAELTGRDESGSLYDIYNLEKESDGLTVEEEAYLIRYLFASNRTDELWGYIVDIGTESDTELDATKMAMKACCYFKDTDRFSKDSDNARQLLTKINERLEDNDIMAEEKEFLLLSQTLLRNCLNQIDYIDMENYETENISEIEYVFLATNAFNSGKYPTAIDYCKTYMDMEREEENGPQKDEREFWKQLEDQEKLVLRYYMQLILANSYFQYAGEFLKDSEQWLNCMEMAEKECAVFEQSSKSLFYIGEQFRILKNSIDLENGRLPESAGENVEVYSREE